MNSPCGLGWVLPLLPYLTRPQLLQPRNGPHDTIRERLILAGLMVQINYPWASGFPLWDPITCTTEEYLSHSAAVSSE